MLLIVCLVDVLILSMVIKASSWSGWPLKIGLIIAFYGANTFMVQIEAVAFLTEIGETLGLGSVPALSILLVLFKPSLWLG